MGINYTHKIYIGGALFNEAEIAQRKLEAKLLRDKFGDDIEVYNPIEMPFNECKDLSVPSPRIIFENDYYKLVNSDIIVCDITNEDAGLMAELGIAYCEDVYIIAVNSDIRLNSANEYDIPPYGMNHFVLGMIQDGGVLVKSFDEALKEVYKFINKINEDEMNQLEKDLYNNDIKYDLNNKDINLGKLLEE